MGEKINLVGALDADAGRGGLERVRIGSDEIALIPFTAEAEAVDLHYCSEADVNDYVHCNGPGCPLCRIGREQVRRLLLPVYVPTAQAVRVLPVSTSLRPGALWPQLGAALSASGPQVVFVARIQGDRHRVSTTPLADDVDAGETAIAEFKGDHEAGSVALESVYPRLGNDDLARLPEVAAMLRLKGIVSS